MTAVRHALVVRQPWATLIALGIKTIETRPAPPNGAMRPEGVRGLPGLSVERGERIAIVAGKARPKDGSLGEFDVWTSFGSGISYLRTPVPRTLGVGLYEYRLPLGAVVCTVVVDDALPMEECPPYSSSFDDRWEPEPPSVLYLGGLNGGPWAFIDSHGPYPMMDQLPLGDFSPGRWGWLLSDPRPCDPVPCKGRQGVFELPDDVTEKVER